MFDYNQIKYKLVFDYNQIKYKLVFQLLLEAGLPAYPQNDDKNTPADLATSAGNKGIVSLLGQYHIDFP